MSSRKRERKIRREALRQQKENDKQAEREAALWGAPIIVVGCMLFMWQVNIFHETFVPERVSLLIIVICSLATMPFFKKWFAKRSLATNNFYVLFYSLFTSGCWFSTAFMATNYYFADTEKITETISITNAGYNRPYKSKCKVPYIDIEHKEVSKQFDFSCGTPVKDYKYVDITFKSGLWGYDVIADKHLHN